MLQRRKKKNKLDKPKRLLRNRKVELRREQCRHQLPVAKQKNERLSESAAVAGTLATTDPGASTSSSDPGSYFYKHKV